MEPGLSDTPTQPADVRSPDRVIEQVDDAVARWPQYAREAGIPPEEIKRIGDDHRLARSLLMEPAAWNGPDLTMGD